ncbi:MAG: hypothetical protein GXO45_05875, partial [Aquificae bacterium]|nr:hypothetical protein [Aquificota bacterium]
MERFFLALAFSILFLFSCSDNDISLETKSNNISYGTAQLGNLANATVEIYKIESDGSLSLLWKETTTSGERLEDIGKFNLHLNELEENSFYLYKVFGGYDWD